MDNEGAMFLVEIFLEHHDNLNAPLDRKDVLHAIPPLIYGLAVWL